MTRLVVALVLLLTLAGGALAAVKPRPLSGQGLLQLRPLPGGSAGAGEPLVLYREPGLGRLIELPPDRLPVLTPALQNLAGAYRVAVTGRKREWLRIVYDEADREGWVQAQRSWTYTPWSQFLKGRMVRLLPGLKKAFYTLRDEAVDTGPALVPLTVDLPLRVVQVDGDWVMVVVGISQAGWLRWRDDNGRFLMAIDERFDPQKR
jgi:hypothetical protein